MLTRKHRNVPILANLKAWLTPSRSSRDLGVFLSLLNQVSTAITAFSNHMPD